MVASETDTTYKLYYAYKTVITYFFVVILAGRTTRNFQISFGIFTMYQFWNLLWIKILYFSKEMYSIKVDCENIPDWLPVSIPSKTNTLLIRKDKVVTSISEFSGVRGAHMMVALRLMSGINTILTVVAIQNDLHFRKAHFLDAFWDFTSENESLFRHDMVPICLFSGAMGMFLTGHFELNLKCKSHTMGHYLGVLGISFATFGIGFLLNWSLFSKILIGLYWALAIIWTWYCEQCIKKSDDVKEVTRVTKWCIGIELAMFDVYSLILVLTTYASGENDGNIFASPLLKY